MREVGNHPPIFTVVSLVACLGANAPLQAVKAVRLLQATDPISVTFTAPFYTRPDPGEDDIF